MSWQEASGKSHHLIFFFFQNAYIPEFCAEVDDLTHKNVANGEATNDPAVLSLGRFVEIENEDGEKKTTRQK